MKISFQIAKNEWRYLFYSPIAWFVLLVFMVQCAFFYSSPLYYYANWQDIMQQNSPSFNGFDFSLTAGLFVGSNVFSNVLNNLCFFIPVLTMGLISRETHSGSSRLLYSSPVSIRQIVIGKYIGIMLYNLLLVGILLFFIITAFFNIGHVDYGLLLSAVLGFYLLSCTYSAIGLFMSALTGHQVVAALSTFIIVFGLGLVGGLWQRYDVVRDLTYFLSLQDRTMKMLSGLIVSRDVIYFIVVAFMFVGFTIVRLKAGREGKPWYIRAGRYMAVLAVSLVIGYVSSRPVLTLYLDATAEKTNTIPQRMQDLIRAMGDSTLEVTLYGNLLGSDLAHALPEVRNVSYMAGMWEPYLRFKPDIRFRYVYYYDTKDSIFLRSSSETLEQRARDRAAALGLDMSMVKSPEEMRRMVNLEAEDYRLIMGLTYRGRTQYLRTYPSYDKPWPDLRNVAAAFKRLLSPEKIPTIYFATGELERNIFKTAEREYAFHSGLKTERNTLVNIGFDVDTVNLNVQEIPGRCTALILADPKMQLDRVAQSKLRKFIENGGNMLILSEPGKQGVLNPLLGQMGVQLMKGQLVQPSYHETPDKVRPYLAAGSGALTETLSGIRQLLERGDTSTMLMPGVMGMAYTPDSAFTISPLLMSRPGIVWLKAGDLVTDSTLPDINLAEGDLPPGNGFTTAAKLTRLVSNREQRIIVCGDADFASNMRLKGNYDYLVALYSWITYNEFPVQMFRPAPKDVLLNTGERGARVQKILYVWVLPGLILLSAIIFLIRRKRQ